MRPFLLQIFAALRFADTIEIAEMWISETAFGGRSVDQKDPIGPLIEWATVRQGIRADGAWHIPVLGYWEIYKQSEGKYRFLRPYFSPKYGPDYNRQASSGTIHALLAKTELAKCFPKLLKLRCHTSRFATCARQLLYQKGQREVPAQWKPGRETPNHYDRAECATERRLRRKISRRVGEGGGQLTRSKYPPMGKLLTPNSSHPRRTRRPVRPQLSRFIDHMET